MYLHIIGEQINQYDSMPVKIRLADGMSRTSLDELNIEQQEAIGLYEYTDTTMDYNPLTHARINEYIYDHNAKTAARVIVERPAEDIKRDSLAQISAMQQTAQAEGYICSNGIKLQTREEDLIRWTQLTITMIAFQPETVTIRDYDNTNHALPIAEVMQMMEEIAAWGQAALQSVWAAKDQVLNVPASI